MQTLMPAALATGATVDLKKTSYKKLGKLLSVFEKKGLLSQKLVHKQEHLATVNRSHALYTGFAASYGDVSSQVVLARLMSQSAWNFSIANIMFSTDWWD